MGQRQCEKCSEMVDEAKAFCPACGNAFVEEEQRASTSSFEAMDSTVQLGQTMYNQMLSDMGLNVGKAPSAPEKRVEVIAPAAAAPSSPPVVKSSAPKQSSSSGIKWIMLGGVIVVVVAMVILAAAVAIYWFWPRTT